jgi:hypothetical protein
MKNTRTISEAPSLTHSVVQAEWTAMMERLKEVATVLEHSELADGVSTGYIILPAFTDMYVVERILFCNLLFEPRTRIENGSTIEIHGNWRFTWRRYAEWSMRPAPFRRMYLEEESLQVFAYQYDVVEVLV